MVSPDPGTFTQPKPVRTPDIKLTPLPAKPTKPTKPVKPKGSKNLTSMNKYNTDLDAYEKEAEKYNDAIKNYKSIDGLQIQFNQGDSTSQMLRKQENQYFK